MDLNRLSPYVRVAMYSTLKPHNHIRQRVIYDYELIYCSGGASDIRIDGVTYRVKEGDAVLLRPGVPHEFIGTDAAFCQPHIHFDVVYDEYSTKRRVSFRDLSDMTAAEREMIQADTLFPDRIPPVFVPRDAEIFRKSFYKVIDIFQLKEANCAVRYKAEMLRLLDVIFRQFNCYGVELRQEESVIAAVKEYIDSNCDRVISLDGLSEQFYINKYTLMRNFAERYGVTVIAYYNEKRLERAKKLLNSEASVSAVSEELGFADIYTFSRFFKNATGYAPSEHRKIAFETK